ncbi:MAG: hypothetical protein J0H14_20675 [Alphaproteobacteria bacterium]|nr:hypothetical protein [Alphaproteobacteria bacterium]
MFIPNTTLCLIDTRYHRLSERAARRCAECCEFERRLYFSDRPWDLDGFVFHRVAPLESIHEYNRLIVRGLADHIDTDHVLVVQYDGFIAEPECWSHDFLDYDYIGAPWPQFDTHNVGNGGFSLRSRRLLTVLRDMKVELDGRAEDVAICQVWRNRLEQHHGIRFAPADVARRFSYESGPYFGPSFGFHGLYHLNRHYKGREAHWLADQLRPEHLAGWRIILLLAQYLRSGETEEARAIFRKVCVYQTLDEICQAADRLGLGDDLIGDLFGLLEESPDLAGEASTTS